MPHKLKLSIIAVVLLSLITPFAAIPSGARNDPGRPTFSKDVAPILYDNCVTCHRPGSIGPFSLQTYQDAKRRARMIATVTEERIMPPWKPEGSHGEFIDERRLSDEQIETLRRWAAAGAPEGDRRDLPPLPTFKDGWQLGTPDLILTMPRPFTIPAEGNDIYMHFVFPLQLDKEKYIRAVEVLPGNRRVAHHAIGMLDNSGKARKLAAKNDGFGYAALNAGFLPSGLTPGFVPGQTPRFMDEGFGIPLKPKTDFVLQVHYHPSGKEEQDQTTVGLYLTDQKPKQKIVGLLLGSENIDIPAGAASHKVVDKFKLPAKMKVMNVWAHMHMIGKGVDVWAELPDGEVKSLLKINDWDFNWQDTYVYQEPFWLPKGTVIRAEFSFDNSSGNPRNPNDPPQRVLFGENSTDEMAGLWIGGTTSNWWNELLLWGGVLGHYLDITDKGKKVRKIRKELLKNSERSAAK